MAAIVFEHVSKRYPGAERPAVDDVSLAVESGQVAVILGTSGSGKTTLLKMVNRLHEASEGRIWLEGVDVCALPANELRRRIGYVIQQIGLFPHWTVAQNVATVPRILGWERARLPGRVDELLNLVGLPPAEFRGRYPSQLSGGQQQRVGIARALAADPGLLLMDEPFGAVDAITRAQLQREFLALQRRTGKTVLFVTHDVDEALRLADRLVVMDQGRVLQAAGPLDVIARPASELVANLVGADNVLRLLGLLSVGSVMQPAGPEAGGQAAALRPTDTLREALTRLLRGSADVLPVRDDAGRLIGQCDLEAIRHQLRRPAESEPEAA